MKYILFFVICFSFLNAETISESKGDMLKSKSTIKITPHEPAPKPIEKKDINNSENNSTDCDIYDPISCAKNTYNDFFGKDGESGVEVVEQDDGKSIYEKTKESVSSGASSLWQGTKNMAKGAMSSTGAFIKRKFDESWEESKREVAKQKAERRKARAEAARKKAHKSNGGSM